MRVSVQIDGDKSLKWDVGYLQIADLVANLETNDLSDSAMAAILEALSTHPAVAVRERVAQKASFLNAATLNRLVLDTEPAVLREVASASSLSTAQIISIVTRCTDGAVEVARRLQDYTNIDLSAVATALLKRDDPAVASGLVIHNYQLPKMIFKSLMTHGDPSVRRDAAKALELAD